MVTKTTVFLGIFLLFIIAVVGYIFFIRNLLVSNTNPTPTPTEQTSTSSLPSSVQVTSTNKNFCSSDNLQSQVSFEGAAGNIYGTFTIKNISSTACTIIGNNKIQTTKIPKNISFNYEGTATNMFTLQPNQTLFGQVHYPNGPQCSGDSITSPISFSYAISNTEEIKFATTGHMNAMITSCTATDEPTEIDLWYLSTTPFH